MSKSFYFHCFHVSYLLKNTDARALHTYTHTHIVSAVGSHEHMFVSVQHFLMRLDDNREVLLHFYECSMRASVHERKCSPSLLAMLPMRHQTDDGNMSTTRFNAMVRCGVTYIYIYMCVSFGYIYILHDSLVLFCFYIYLFYSHFSTDDRRTSTGSYVSVEVYFLCIYKNTFNARMTRLYVSPVCWLCWVCLIATNDLHIYIIQYTYVLHCIRGAEDCMSKISSYKYHKVSWVLAHIWATNLHAYAT